MAFGLITYSNTDNLGDEIQSLAALQHLPEPVYFLNRDALATEGDAIEGHASVIMNGWYCQYPENWPPSEKIRPLLVSVHITQETVHSKTDVTPSEFLLAPTMVKYLKYHEPVGARDLTTLKLLQNAGVDAYFSGCLTLTLDRPDVSRSDDLVVFADIPDEVLAFARTQTCKHVFRTSHVGFPEERSAERFHRARELISLYARASCVVTARLHCALPCLAMGTPVLLVDVAADRYRFTGLDNFLHHASPEEYLSGAIQYDIDNPPPNKTNHLFYRQALIQRVKKFVDGDKDFVWAKNEDHPSQADREAAIHAIRERKKHKVTLRASRSTFLKRRDVWSTELNENEKIQVKPGTELIGFGLEPFQQDTHYFMDYVLLDRFPVDPGQWCVYANHWYPEAQQIVTGEARS